MLTITPLGRRRARQQQRHDHHHHDQLYQFFQYLTICLFLVLTFDEHSQTEAANVAINNRTLEDWLVVDLSGSNTYKPMFIKNHSVVPHDDVSHWPVNTYYWQAPQPYYQWKIYTYGGNLTFIVNHIVTRGDTSGKYLDEPDLVLEGGSREHRMKIGYRLRKADDDDDIIRGYDKNQTIKMPLSETDWKYLVEQEDPETRVKHLKLGDQQVSRADFSLVLAGLDRAMIRAKYHMDQVEGNLYDVSMSLAGNKSRTIECNNDCTGVLLDDLDDIGLLMDEIRRLAPGLKDGPWRRLAWLSGRADNLTEALSAYLKLIAQGKEVIEFHALNFDLETLADMLGINAINLDSRAPIIASEAFEVRLLAEKTLDELMKLLWGKIFDIIKQLNEHGFSSGGASPGKIERIVQESEMILRELRNRNFKIPLEEAEKELRKSKILLDKIRTLLIDPDKSAELLKRLERLQRVLMDFARIVQEQVLTPVKSANELIAEGKKRYQLLLAMLKDADNLARESQANLDEAKRLLELTRKCLADEAKYLDQLPRQLIELNNSIHEIEVKRSILTQVNPVYQVDYVDKCRNHKDELVKKAKELDGLFNATRDVADYALRAANVYKNIISAIERAEQAAKRAYDAAEKAYKVAVPDNDESLADKAREAKRKSLELLEKAKKLRDLEVQRLSLELAKRKQIIDMLIEQVNQLFKDLDAINAGLKQLADKNLLEQLQEIDAFLRRLLERIAEIHKRLQLLSDLIYNAIIPNFDRLSAGSQSSLGNLSQVIDLARKDLLNAIKFASSSKLTLEKILKLEAKLDIDLDLLRRKIQLAHQEASSIRVSIMPSAETGVCTRSYFIPSTLSGQESGGLSVAGFNIRHLSLVWSLHHDTSESLLLFIGSKTDDEFLALEMYDKRIRLVHKLNAYSPSGVQVLTHSRPIEMNDKNLLSDEAWYHISVTMGNDDQLRLNVKPLGLPTGSGGSGKSDSSGRSSSSEVSHRLSLNSMGISRLQTSPFGEADINFYVGGLPPSNEYAPPEALRSVRLAGCLYNLNLNHHQLGLWNFKTNQGCQGCMEGPVQKQDTATFSFSGSQSYSTVAQYKPYDRTRYMLSMSVKTTDANALLFLTLSETSSHYLSVFIDKGRIGLLVGKLNPHQTTNFLGLSSSSLFDHALSAHLQALRSNYSMSSLGQQPAGANGANNQTSNSPPPPLEHLITSSQEYNNDQWVKITAEKDQNRLVLVVDSEYKESVIDDKLLTLDMDQVFFGGVWPMVRPKKFARSSIEFESFAGCMKDVQIETSPVDLVKRQFHGVEMGCTPKHSTRSLLLASARADYPLPAGR